MSKLSEHTNSWLGKFSKNVSISVHYCNWLDFFQYDDKQIERSGEQKQTKISGGWIWPWFDLYPFCFILCQMHYLIMKICIFCHGLNLHAKWLMRLNEHYRYSGDLLLCTVDIFLINYHLKSYYYKHFLMEVCYTLMQLRRWDIMNCNLRPLSNRLTEQVTVFLHNDLSTFPNLFHKQL